MYAKLKEVANNLNLDDTISLSLQDPSLSRTKKRKAMELEPKTYIDDLYCNMVLPEGVKFKENKATKEPEFELIYKMMALPGKSPANVKFFELMDNIIQERHDKHILLTKQAKLELMGIKPEK
ncbi:hypothetical protein Tco_0697401 [Tanacetum coccineum]